MTSHHLAYLFGLAAILLWSTVATAFKIALGFFTPLQLVFVATITSIVTLGAMVIFQGKCKLMVQQFWQKPSLYLQTGLLNPFLYYLVLFKAYDLLPAQQALALNYTWAILLPLLAVPLLGQALRKSDVISAVVAYIGVVIIATGGNITSFTFEQPLGIIFALASTLLWCLYWIVNTKDKGDPVISLLLSFCVSLPFITIALLWSQSLPSMSPSALAAGIYVGLFEMGISFVLWLMALKKAKSASQISTLVFLTPLLSMALIALILKEDIARATFVGMGFILSALALQQVLPKLGSPHGKDQTPA
ncbi:DMT family transporter [Shewanella sp. NIFS-20-20]|uniref:DMT family transporter n=1 Tax=Shewanella sp. NIFS-20-20 TaxID=2853806 RepID=UPI001C444E37|nr:DMT family transporter [Shewanella sp. NIFS-20-20]MBV7317068.1 DMT family transporter [Shewanella sp. NIFS-20-20]